MIMAIKAQESNIDIHGKIFIDIDKDSLMALKDEILRYEKEHDMDTVVLVSIPFYFDNKMKVEIPAEKAKNGFPLCPYGYKMANTGIRTEGKCGIVTAFIDYQRRMQTLIDEFEEAS